jgi:uncharacterized protein YcbX
MALTVASLHVYPVKGLKGIDLQEARATERGLQHDRRWMVVDPQGEFFTQRTHPRMATVWTELLEGSLELSAPHVGSVTVPLVPPPAPFLRVRVWNSVVDAVPASREADAFLSDYLEAPCRLVHMPDSTRRASNPAYSGDGERLVGFADGYAYLVVGTSSLEDLNRRLAGRGHPALPMTRFRPNIVVSGAPAYAEDGWGEIRVGDAVLRAAKPCGRCEVTTTDQSTGEVRGPEPLATLATYRTSDQFGVMFGMNLVTVQPGLIRIADRIDA